MQTAVGWCQEVLMGKNNVLRMPLSKYHNAASMKVLLGIPCYRCENQIARVIGKLSAELLGRVEKVIILDNASPDGTFDRAHAAVRAHASLKIEVQRNTENLGLGGSVKSLAAAGHSGGFDALIVLHGDDQAEPAEIHALLDAFEADQNLAAVLGARFMRGARTPGYSWRRNVANRALNGVFSIALARRISDIGSGLNLYNLAAFTPKLASTLPTHIAFDVPLLCALSQHSGGIRFLPITWKEEDQISTVKNLTVGLLVLSELVQWRLLNRP